VDTLKVGLGSAGRRPLRTSLTTSGVAIGIAAMSLIVALAGGLQSALGSPALAKSQLHQVVVYPAPDASATSFDAATLSTFAGQQHVTRGLGPDSAERDLCRRACRGDGSACGRAVSLPPRSQANSALTLSAGRLPSSDSAPEVVLTTPRRSRLGFGNPATALNTPVKFSTLYGVLALTGQQKEPRSDHSRFR